jgi:hypothetical protein
MFGVRIDPIAYSVREGVTRVKGSARHSKIRIT